MSLFGECLWHDFMGDYKIFEMKNEAVAVAVQVNFQENMHTSRVVLCKLDHVIPTSHAKLTHLKDWYAVRLD